MTTAVMNATDGTSRKADAHALLEAHRELYVLRGRRALLAALLERGTATADDVRHAVELPDDLDPKCFGAVPRELVRLGLIEHAGFTTTARPKAHARPVSVWRLRDRAGAIAWLNSNADRPAPDCSGTGRPKQSLFD